MRRALAERIPLRARIFATGRCSCFGSAMQVPLLDLSEQYRRLAGPIREEIEEILRTQNFILGPKVEEFECALADYCGAKYAVGVEPTLTSGQAKPCSRRRRAQLTAASRSCLDMAAMSSVDLQE